MSTYLSKPIEREYEAWIIGDIQRYFDSLDIKALIWAVSPTYEAYWPADENVFAQGKLFGLQFKQAKLKIAPNPSLIKIAILVSLTKPVEIWDNRA